jgi:hypothetical protein
MNEQVDNISEAMEFRSRVILSSFVAGVVGGVLPGEGLSEVTAAGIPFVYFLGGAFDYHAIPEDERPNIASFHLDRSTLPILSAMLGFLAGRASQFVV